EVDERLAVLRQQVRPAPEHERQPAREQQEQRAQGEGAVVGERRGQELQPRLLVAPVEAPQEAPGGLEPPLAPGAGAAHGLSRPSPCGGPRTAPAARRRRPRAGGAPPRCPRSPPTAATPRRGPGRTGARPRTPAPPAAGAR